MATNKKIAQTAVKAGAMVGKRTVAPTDKKQNVQKNIQSAKGNTSNAYTPQHKLNKAAHAGSEATWSLTSGKADKYWESTHNADGSKKSVGTTETIVGKGNKETVEAPEWQKRTNAAKKQNEARIKQTEARLPSLDDYKEKVKSAYSGASATLLDSGISKGLAGILNSLQSNEKPNAVFNGTKHADNGLGWKDNFLNAGEAVLAGMTSGMDTYRGKDLLEYLLGNEKANEMLYGGFNRKRSDMGMGVPLSDDEKKEAQALASMINYNQEQHPTATKVGEFGGKAAQYATVNALADSIPVLDTARQAISGKLGGGAIADNIAKSLVDYGVTDLPLDTVPSILNDIQAGLPVDEIVKNALKNAGVNIAFNVGLGTLGNGREMLDDLSGKLDTVKEGMNNLPSLNKTARDYFSTIDNGIKDYVPEALKEAEVPKEVLAEVPKETPVKEYGSTSIKGYKKESASLRQSVDQYGGDSDKYHEIFKALNEYQDTGDEALLTKAHDLAVTLDGELTGKTFKRGKGTYNYQDGSYIAKVDNFIDKLAKSKTYAQYPTDVVEGVSLGKPISALRERANNALNPDGVNKSIDEFISNLNEVMAKNDEGSWNKVMKSFNDVLQSDATLRSDGEAVAQEMYSMIDRVESVAKQSGTKNIAESISEPTVTKKLDELEAPAKQVANTEPEFKQNKYSNVTVPEKTSLATEAPEVIDALKDNPQVYAVAKNADSSAIADDILLNNDFDKAYGKFGEMLAKKEPASVPLGYRLARQAAKDGKTELAVEIVERMGSELTKAGQFTQAAAIEMLKDDPLAMMRYMEKQIDKLNAEGIKKYHRKWKDFSLTDEEKKLFTDMAPGDKEALDELTHNIALRLTEEYPVTVWEKLVEASHTAMLLNPKTHIRNIVSNTAMKPLTSLSDRVEGVMQNAYKKFNPDFEVTQSMVGGTKAQKQAAKEIFDTDFKELTEGVSNSKYNEVAGSNIRRNRQIFKDSYLGTKAKELTVKIGDKVTTSKISPALDKLTKGKLQEVIDGLPENMKGSFMENLRNFDYWLLGAVEDDPYVKSRFVNRLASYMKANNIDDVKSLTGDALKKFENAKAVAWEEALEATFKDDNFMTKMFSGIKNSTGKFGDVLLPFVKTPANIAMRGIDYSPAGFVKAFVEGVKGGSADQVINSLAKATTGTGLVALGYALRQAGLIRGELSDDKEVKAYQKQQGQLPYSFNVFGKDVTFDWAQPSAIPLIIGVTMADAADNPDRKWYEHVADATIAAGDAWTDLSPLQTFQDIFTGNGYEDSSPIQNVLGEIGEYPQRLIPALMGATARANDNTYRNTYVPEDARDLTNNYYLNSMKAKMPALGDEDNWWNENVSSESLPASYDLWGRERKRASSEGLNAFQQFLFPGNIGNDMSTDIDPEINRLNELGFNATPNKAAYWYKQNGQTYRLNNEEQSAWQKDMGQLSYQMAKNFMNSDEYKNLSDEQKVNVLHEIYNLADNIAKDKNFLEFKYDDKNGYADMSKTLDGQNQIISDFIRNEKFKDSGISRADWKDEAYNNGEYDTVQAATNIAREYGKDNISESEYKDYKKFGEKYLRDELAEEQLFDSYDLPTNDVTRTLLSEYGESELPSIKQASDDITSIVKGTDKWGDDTYQGFTTKLYGIWKDYGKSGAETYSKMLQYDGNGDKKTGSYADIIPYLEKTNLSDKEKNYYIEKKATKSDGTLSDSAQAWKEVNPSTGLYDKQKISLYADGMGTDNKGNANKKNGSLTQNEFIAYMNGNKEYSKEIKEAYFRLLWPNAKKIPNFD